MSIVQPELPEARVLDLFAGSGALGIEALSRGARRVEFVELSPRSLAALRDNLRALGAEPDIAFADPPYRLGLAERLARRWLELPFATVLGIEHEKAVHLPGSEDRRVYGDTVVTFYRTG